MKNVDRALALAAQIMEIEKKVEELHKMDAELRAELEAMLMSKAEPTPAAENEAPRPDAPKELGGYWAPPWSVWWGARR